jgi:hypothetical protein
MFSGDKSPQKSIWETHGDALGMLLRARGTSSQFASKETGGISRGAHRIIVPSIPLNFIASLTDFHL